MKVHVIDQYLAFVKEGSSVVVTSDGELPKGLTTSVVTKAIQRAKTETETQDFFIANAGYIQNLLYVNTAHIVDKLPGLAQGIVNLIESTDTSKVVLSLKATNLRKSDIEHLESYLSWMPSRQNFSLYVYQ